MSLITINLVVGNGFTHAYLAAAKVSVKVNKLKTKATANLATGALTAIGDDTDIIPFKVANNSYKAIVVPQAVGEGNLITVNVDGRNFICQRQPTLEVLRQARNIVLMLP